MSEMLTRVAAALERVLDQVSSGEFYLHQDGYEQLARAAVGALREPTEAMYYAGDAQYESERDSILGPAPIPMWRAMIDKALE